MDIFEKMIRRVEENLVGCSFKNAEYSSPIIDQQNFENWKNLLISTHSQFISEHFDSLQMIVLASSGKEGFNGALAMINRDLTDVVAPGTVNKLIDCLHWALCSRAADEGHTFQDHHSDLGFDYGCMQLKERVLFLNVCLTNDPRNHVYAVLSIAFINELLREVAQRRRSADDPGKPLAVLDFRLVMHKHLDNVLMKKKEDEEEKKKEKDASDGDGIGDEDEGGDENGASGKRIAVPSFSWEKDFVCNAMYRQEDERYKIVNPDDYHHYYPFGHPSYMPREEIPNDDFNRMFQEIDKKGYPIRLMYMPAGCTW